MIKTLDLIFNINFKNDHRTTDYYEFLFFYFVMWGEAVDYSDWDAKKILVTCIMTIVTNNLMGSRLNFKIKKFLFLISSYTKIQSF
jgi:hypothetical protein